MGVGMLGSHGSQDSDSGVTDARAAALDLMNRALAHLDGDQAIPEIIGAHLQMAIDALARLEPGSRFRPASNGLG
jgi:hypothetical protein